jgi:antitoxin MazE
VFDTDVYFVVMYLDKSLYPVYLLCIYIQEENTMITKVQKWGNSLALRIPKAFAADARLENDTVVEMSFVDGQIVVKPVARPTWTLEQLLAGVKSGNMHHEVDTGGPAGREIW